MAKSSEFVFLYSASGSKRTAVALDELARKAAVPSQGYVLRPIGNTGGFDLVVPDDAPAAADPVAAAAAAADPTPLP